MTALLAKAAGVALAGHPTLYACEWCRQALLGGWVGVGHAVLQHMQPDLLVQDGCGRVG